jgi:hypothetical protein
MAGSATDSATRQAAAAAAEGDAASSSSSSSFSKDGAVSELVAAAAAAPGCNLEQPLAFILVIPDALGRDSDALRRIWAPLAPFLRKEVALPANAHGYRTVGDWTSLIQCTHSARNWRLVSTPDEPPIK